ncbi:hypothetical protein SAMN04487910_1022 [Aquimarina amphilecti]|uniref:Carboxypeptidase regulatory-like domain-containing protein n=1 Tax=Aquimarina amphilecti TaxID=1038014 RepID=A0A1H7JKK1_AQUAM|nr:hypothetical protein [Aquimarina amphilecti]SEK75091.1 hypothetical protein SAMN04487910_1022 [Aquimarina amphilecti]
MKKLVLILLVICTACNLDEQDTLDPVFCTDELRAGLEITVKDATVNDLFLTSGITVTIVDGDYTETLVNFDNTNLFVGAFERTGTYVITVRGDNYETFTSTVPIIVDKDICHVITESREIILQPN